MFLLLFCVLSFVFTAPCDSKIIVGEIQTVSGETLYVAQMDGATGGINIIDNKTVELEHGPQWNSPRIYFAKECAEDWKPDMFREFKLLGGSISYETHIGDMGCACNAAVYLSAMPGYKNDGKTPDPGSKNDYYCDANGITGVFCPEIDIQEANQKAWQITPHKCNNQQGLYYPNCDNGGCYWNTGKEWRRRSSDDDEFEIIPPSPTLFGPGDSYTVNSQNWIKVTQEYLLNGTNLKTIVTTVHDMDRGKEFQMVHDLDFCKYKAHTEIDYLAALTESFQRGMVLIASNWGEGAGMMYWLDIPPCDPNTNCNYGSYRIRNIEVKEGKY